MSNTARSPSASETRFLRGFICLSRGTHTSGRGEREKKKAVKHAQHFTHLRVGLGVLKDAEQHLRGLLGPPSLAVGGTLVLSLGGSADATAEAAEDDAATHGDDLLQVRLGGGQIHLLDRHGGLAHVLEVDAKVAAARFAGLSRVFGLTGVLHHAAF